MTAPKIAHIQFDVLGLARIATPEMLIGITLADGSHPKTRAELEVACLAMRDAGYTVIPCGCPEAQDPPGVCPGWVSK